MYIETMQQILTSSTKVLVDARGSGNLLYLPLDKHHADDRAASPDGVTTLKPMPLGVDAVGGSVVQRRRSRDALRAREREARP